MNQTPSPSTSSCTDQATAPETLKIPGEPLAIDPAADALRLQDAINMRMDQALAILIALLANDHLAHLSNEVLTPALDGARYLLEEATVLNTRQWEVYRGGTEQ